MNKTEPIIFQLHNYKDEKVKFELPFVDKKKRWCKVNYLSPKQRNVKVDIKVNTQWHKKVSPKKFKFELMPNLTYTVLIQPHDEKYFAGWARWFNWGNNGYNFERNNLLKTVLSDPDYAHLESETEIGDDFRFGQYRFCRNLCVAPHEDLDGEFEEIGDCFRAMQYSNCKSLSVKPTETLPTGIKKIGFSFRGDQYAYTKFKPDKLTDPQLCKIAVEGDGTALELVADELKSEALCKLAVTESYAALEFVPDELKSEEICGLAARQTEDAFPFIPDKFRTEENYKKWGLIKICKMEI